MDHHSKELANLWQRVMTASLKMTPLAFDRHRERLCHSGARTTGGPCNQGAPGTRKWMEIAMVVNCLKPFKAPYESLLHVN